MNRNKQKAKPYWEMNAAELAQATKEFEGIRRGDLLAAVGCGRSRPFPRGQAWRRTSQKRQGL